MCRRTDTDPPHPNGWVQEKVNLSPTAQRHVHLKPKVCENRASSLVCAKVPPSRVLGGGKLLLGCSERREQDLAPSSSMGRRRAAPNGSWDRLPESCYRRAANCKFKHVKD